MKIKYDKKVDVLNIQLNENKIVESDEKTSGIILDFDSEGKVVEIEILDFSKRTPSPAKVEYELA
jgi:uncharacterized protein YuzE